MRKTASILVFLALLAGCGHHHTSATLNPQEKKDAAAAQKIVQQCVSKGTVLTKAGRTKILDCIAPQGHTVALETCFEKAAISDKLFTKRERERFYNDAATCVQRNR